MTKNEYAPGTILVDTWTMSDTYINFFQVVKVAGNECFIKEIERIYVSDTRAKNIDTEPVKDDFKNHSSKPVKEKITSLGIKSRFTDGFMEIYDATKTYQEMRCF